MLGGDVSVPDGVFGIEANTIREAATEICPHPTVGQAAGSIDVESSQSVTVGLGEDQRRVVRGHDHAIGESASLCYLLNRAIGCDQNQDAGGELATWEVEAEVADVGIASTVHYHVAPGVARQVAQVGLSHQRTIVLAAQE